MKKKKNPIYGDSLRVGRNDSLFFVPFRNVFNNLLRLRSKTWEAVGKLGDLVQSNHILKNRFIPVRK